MQLISSKCHLNASCLLPRVRMPPFAKCRDTLNFKLHGRETRVDHHLAVRELHPSGRSHLLCRTRGLCGQKDVRERFCTKEVGGHQGSHPDEMKTPRPQALETESQMESAPDGSSEDPQSTGQHLLLGGQDPSLEPRVWLRQASALRASYSWMVRQSPQD